jgi:hypothetical protein
VKKIRALVNSVKGNWILWEINGFSPDIFEKLRSYLNIKKS